MIENDVRQRQEQFKRRLARELGLRPSQTAQFVWQLINDPTVTVNVDLEGLRTDEHFEKLFQEIKRQIHW